ncbi:MAG: hypothetical protein ACTSUF_02170 [Candidatus Heimdallarchaeaceae archaeon]
MIVADGKSMIIDQIANIINQGGLGTDDTAPAESDTGLNSNTNFGTSGTIKSVSSTVSTKQVVFDYNLPSTDGNGNTYKEFGLSSSSENKLFNRQTFADLSKTSSIEIQISCAISIE